MTEAEVVQTMREHYEGLFPKVCPNCKRRFATLREYILITQRIGPAMSFDAELGNWKTAQPIGTVAQVNCPCGTTLGLGTESMPLSRRLELLDWIRAETQRRGMSPSALMEHLRDEVRKLVLGGPVPGDA